MNEIVTTITAITGAVLTVLAFFVPKYVDAEPRVKALVMIGANLLVSAVIFVAGCYGFSKALELPEVVCSTEGALTLVRIFLTMIAANQVTYVATRKVLEKNKVT